MHRLFLLPGTPLPQVCPELTSSSLVSANRVPPLQGGQGLVFWPLVLAAPHSAGPRVGAQQTHAGRYPDERKGLCSVCGANHRAASPANASSGVAGAARREPTFEEDDLVVGGALVHGVHAIQVQRQAPPETVHLRRLQRHQVPIPGQPPEVCACGHSGWGCRWQAWAQGTLPPRRRTPWGYL